MGNGVMTVPGHFCQYPIFVDQDLGCLCLLNNPMGKRWAHPDIATKHFEGVEIEEYIGFGIIGDAIFHEDIPELEILIPIAEFHIEASIYRLIEHLIVKPLPISHSPLPFGSTWFNFPPRHKAHPLSEPFQMQYCSIYI